MIDLKSGCVERYTQRDSMNNDWGSIDLYTVTHCDTTHVIKPVDVLEMHASVDAYFDTLFD